jgi:S-DNA-T family DNA segregation ATPase FtsK/SpoIIIE
MPKRVNRRVLEAQSDRIEAVLAHHKVRAKVTGGVVAPAWIRFQILPQLGARINKIKGLAEEFALALSTDACRVTRDGGNVVLEIPREDPQPVRLLPLLRAYLKQGGLPFGTALLGIADDGVPLMVRLPSPQVAHLLVAGTTGSGKSALSKTIITSLALTHRPSQLGFVLIDPKGRGFGAFAGLPHLLRPVLTEPRAAQEVLQRLVQLMLQRDREGRSPATGGQAGDPRVVVVIDELADLLMTTGSGTQDALTRLSQRGREAGIHVIACTQKPASRVVGGLAKANFPVRLVGRVTSPEEAKVATGYAGTGAEQLRGPGDFMVVAGGQVTRFQAAWVSSAEIAALVAHMRGPVDRPASRGSVRTAEPGERPALVRRTGWRGAAG